MVLCVKNNIMSNSWTILKLSSRWIFRAQSWGGESPSERVEHMVVAHLIHDTLQGLIWPLYPGHTLGPTHNDLDRVQFQSNINPAQSDNNLVDFQSTINPAQSDNNRVDFQSDINPTQSRIRLWSGLNPPQSLNIAQFGYIQGLNVVQLADINPTSIQVNRTITGLPFNHTSICLNQRSDNDLDSIKHNPEIAISPWLNPPQS